MTPDRHKRSINDIESDLFDCLLKCPQIDRQDPTTPAPKIDRRSIAIEEGETIESLSAEERMLAADYVLGNLSPLEIDRFESRLNRDSEYHYTKTLIGQ